MNTKYFKAILFGSLCLILVLMAALSTTPSSAGTVSPFVGQWFAIDDFDGSDIRLTIAGKNNGPFTITWTESYFSGCGGEAGIVRGKGSLIESDIMIADLTLVCFKTNNTIPFEVQWVYDPGTDTLNGDFITWHRAQAIAKPCITPLSGMSGWWSGDGNASDLIFGRNGTFNGDPITASGLVNLSFRLDGDGDFISVPDDPGLNFGPGDFTIDLWVNFNNANGEQVLIEKWIQGNDPLTTSGWTLTKLTGQVLRLAMANGQGVEANLDSGSLDIRPDIWYHFATTRHDHTITLYMNGEPVASQEMDVLNLNSTSSLKFGHRGNPEDTPGSTDNRGFYLNGRIDEVEIFNGTALSVEQIKAIYSAGSAGKCKDAIITPQMFNLRINYGHDWVESFYETGHTVKIMVTEADGSTVKATAEVITEPKDFWDGKPGFQTRLEDWVPGPPDIRPYDWVFGWVDNGASAQLELGEINGSVDIEKDEVTGNINAPWISDMVTVECHPWGAPEPQEMKYDWVFPDNADTYTCSWVDEWDIQPGQVVGVSYFDQYGNWVANALYPPWIRAHPEWDSVDGWYWPENKTITMTVDDPDTGTKPDISITMPGTVEPNGSLWFELNDYDLKVGDEITMTDGVIIKNLIVSNLTIVTIDFSSGIVAGSADPLDGIRLPVPGELFVLANEYGDWIADFASAGYNLQPGMTMIAEESDDDGDLTSYEVLISNARIVASEAGDWFWTTGFNQGSLDLYIYESAQEGTELLWSGQAEADESGFSIIGIEQHGLDLVPGNYLVVSDGVNTKGIVLQSIWITYFDTRNEIMAGYAPPGSLVWAAAGPLDWQQKIMMSSDRISGEWEADFKTVNFDITEDMRGSSYAHVYDKDGDANEGSTPSPLQKPYFTIFPEWEWYDGLNWPDGALVSISVIGKGDPCTTTRESWGGFFNGGFPVGCDVKVGDTVRMTDGTTTQEHTVRNLAITVVDEALDTVSGMADLNSRVYVWPHATGQELVATAYDGAWQVDFSEIFDLAPNECGRAQIYDSEGNGTAIDWCVPFTLINVFPVGNYVEIHDWRQGVTATASIVGKEGCTGTTVPIYPDWEPQYRNPMQIYFPEGCDIDTDDVVRVDNGITYREHIVQNLSVITVDGSADTVSGTADPTALVHVWPHGYGEIDLHPTVGSDGSWTADFSGLIDLQEGLCGRSAIWDEAGNSTSVDWCVPPPP